MLTPADIQRQQFTVRRVGKGYDPDEVDNYLDAVSGTIAELMGMVDGLTIERDNLRNTTQVLTPLESAQRLLDVAQRTADEVVRQAEVEGQKAAAQITSESRLKAAELVSAAQTEHDKLRQVVTDLNSAKDIAGNTLRQALTALETQ